MKGKQCLIASVVVFVVFFIVEYVVHGIFLKEIYQETADLWRPEADMKKMMWFMWLGYLIFSPIFVCIYSKGYEEGKSGIGQGFRYGLSIGLLIAPLSALGWYAVLPIPGQLAVCWLVTGIIEFTLLGLVVGLIYKKA